MMVVYKRVRAYLQRIYNAKKWGIKFFRSSSFTIPEKINFGGYTHSLYFDNSVGNKVAFVDIFLDDDYRINTLTNPTFILDVGANIGFFSLKAALMFPQAKIHCYEPNYKLDNLKDNLKNLNNVHVHLVGLSNKEANIFLDTSGDSVNSNVSCDGDLEIKIISLSSALKDIQIVDFAKIDCEGSEWQLVKDPAFKKIQKGVMEYHLNEKFPHKDEIINQIRSLGYEVELLFAADAYGLLHFTK